MYTEGSLKELYDVKIKSTYPIEIGNRSIEKGEVIAYFDKISMSGIDENITTRSAHGGADDVNRIFWDSTKDASLYFSQGIFSPMQLSLLTNNKLVQVEEDTIEISNREFLESDESGEFELKENPSGQVFVYNKETGAKLTATLVSGKKYKIANTYLDIIVDYEYKYDNSASIVNIGEKLLKGYVSLEGRTKIKEDVTGNVKTGIIKIPKLKIMSTLSLRLGTNASPQGITFKALAVPVGERGERKNYYFYYLEDDIDSDL